MVRQETVLVSEPGGIHFLYFFLLVSAKTIAERKGDALQVAFRVHVEILCRTLVLGFIVLKMSLPFSWSMALSLANV